VSNEQKTIKLEISLKDAKRYLQYLELSERVLRDNGYKSCPHTADMVRDMYNKLNAEVERQT